MFKSLFLWLLPLAATAQNAEPPAPARWAMGFGVGNGVEAHGGYYGRHLLAYGRVRGKWWGPVSGLTPGASGATLAPPGEELTTRNRQVEVAALLGDPLTLGRSTLYAATGLAYLDGRRLGEYRYTLRQSGILSTEPTHYYRYRDYRALGLPVEIGYLAPVTARGQYRVGIAAQANYNPEQTVYCLLLTLWLGVGKP